MVPLIAGRGDGEKGGDRPALDDLEPVVDQAPFDVLRLAEVRFDPPAQLREPQDLRIGKRRPLLPLRLDGQFPRPACRHGVDGELLGGDRLSDNVTVTHLENGDTADVRKGGRELVLHFHTFGATDGVQFTVKGAEHMRLDLKLDGKPIGTDSIFFGPQARHPKHNPFKLKF